MRKQSIEEELANSLTHGVGILFSVVAISVMTTFSVLNNNWVSIFSTAFFGSALLLMYTFSTLYHAIQHEKTKKLLQVFDHISIYILIAGTYTPFLLLGVGGWLAWLMFGILWFLALAGIFFKAFYRDKFPKLSLILYLGMGWIAVFIAKPLYESLSTQELMLIIGGGLSYTIGTIFYSMKARKYMHAIWHVFVFIGTLCHFIAVMSML